MNGHFSGFQNRQKIRESKKSIRREKLETRKTDLIDYALHNANSTISIPTIPEDVLHHMKNDMRKKLAHNRSKQSVLMIATFVILIILLTVFAIKQNVL